ncbi:AI-2E family transporter [Jiella sp. M17.18]|uniref:AI-2E family transporter n=1 Tax=Jiella sp. M17.18 TaxID=3234247 RepID=UPI0034E01E5C
MSVVRPSRAKLRSSDVPSARMSRSVTDSVIVGLAIVAVLYFGRDVFVPIALAVLLSFALAPLVRVLRRIHVPRKLAVALAVVVAFLLLLGLGGMMVKEVTQLAENLPSYQTTIVKKIQSLRGSTNGGGAIARVAATVDNLRQELSGSAGKPDGGAGAGNAPQGQAGGQTSDAAKKTGPIPVEIHEPPAGPLDIIQSIVSPVLSPLATAGIVTIFAIFILLYRQDLRDRFIRLAGSKDLGRTTAAIDDAAHRLSRYFLTQTAINVTFGVIVAAGLWLIGIPNPELWGIFGALLRFIPYIGSILSGLFPAALAFAVDPGWSSFIWTVALFVVVETIIGQVIEPWLYGHNTGLSPVAVIVAATFWTWLWGPIGLFLSTPLTVCLVVIGRHVEKLAFLEVILGDEPALTPPENFYQRMLAGDPHEAADQAEDYLREESLQAFYDNVAIEGLLLAQEDLNRGLLDDEKLIHIRDTALEVVDDLSDHRDEDEQGDEAAEAQGAHAGHEGGEDAAAEAPLPAGEPRQEGIVLCIGARTPLDEAAVPMLAQLLERHGIATRCEPRDTLLTTNIFRLDTAGVTMVCLSYLDGSRAAEVRYLVRRLRRKMPQARILLGFWGMEAKSAAEELRASSGADFQATSLRQAVDVCRTTLPEPAAAKGLPARPHVGLRPVTARGAA